jgi:hypothetical protein
MQLKTSHTTSIGSIFIVRFKFKKYNNQTNIRLSKIPILMIAGFPGFREKIWMIDWKTSFWQGVYEFNDVESIEKYKKSFVLKLMNKRAAIDTISFKIVSDTHLSEYIKL